MKNRKLLRFAVMIGVLSLFGCSVIHYDLKLSVDDPDGVRELEGLSGEVTIRRDDLGIPFIEAKNEDDLFFATGFAMASDRIWQMTVMKMLAQGRMAEVIGEDALGPDLLMRTLGLKHSADEAYQGLDDPGKKLLAHFAAGVNAYLGTHSHLPVEFGLTSYTPGPWQPQDSLYVFGLANLFLAANLKEELAFLALSERFGSRQAAYLFPVYPDEELPFQEASKLEDRKLTGLGPTAGKLVAAYDRVETLLGLGGPASNNWAISGTRTKSGKSIVANDTHLDLTFPSFWLIMHLKSPTYEAAGVMVPGVPLVTLGFNGHVAWGATMVMADSQDLFLERLETREGRTCYSYLDQCIPIEERDETFRVKGKEPVVRKVRSTRHGPLLDEALQPPEDPSSTRFDLPAFPLPFRPRLGIAFRWTMADGDRGLTGFTKLARARNVEQAREALSLVDSIYLNILYGDRQDIAWQVTGRFPIRKKGTGQLPSPGWTGEYDWDGFVPFEENPHSLNPAEGYIGTANNRTVGRDAAVHMSSSWFGPERAERIRQILSEAQDVALDDMTKMHADQYSLMAKKTQDLLFHGAWAGEIREAIEGLQDRRERDQARQALAMLGPDRFNCVLKPDSVPAALLGAFHRSFTREVFLQEMGGEDSFLWRTFLELNYQSYAAPEDHLLVRESSPFWDREGISPRKAKAEKIVKSLADAYAFCEEHMGSDVGRWQWGKLHTYHWVNEATKAGPLLGWIADHLFRFNRGPYPAGGDMQTLNVSGYYWGKDFDVVLIPAMRLVVDFGLADPAYLITHGGQSGDPASPHYDDMIDPWIRVQNHPLPFAEESVDRQYLHRVILKPAPLE